jgi:hypothetical protein
LFPRGRGNEGPLPRQRPWMADAASRDKLDFLHHLSASVGVAARRITLPPREIAFFESVKAAARLVRAQLPPRWGAEAALVGVGALAGRPLTGVAAALLAHSPVDGLAHEARSRVRSVWAPLAEASPPAMVAGGGSTLGHGPITHAAQVARRLTSAELQRCQHRETARSSNEDKNAVPKRHGADGIGEWELAQGMPKAAKWAPSVVGGWYGVWDPWGVSRGEGGEAAPASREPKAASTDRNVSRVLERRCPWSESWRRAADPWAAQASAPTPRPALTPTAAPCPPSSVATGSGPWAGPTPHPAPRRTGTLNGTLLSPPAP